MPIIPITSGPDEELLRESETDVGVIPVEQAPGRDLMLEGKFSRGRRATFQRQDLGVAQRQAAGAPSVGGAIEEERQALQEQGVSLEGASGLARLFLGLTANASGEEARGFVEQALSAAYKRPVQVQYNEGSNSFLFEDPTQNGQLTVVNPPGFDLGDLMAAAPTAGVIGVETGASLAGASLAVTNPAFIPHAAVAGGSFGAAIGEATRLAIGNSVGANNFTEDEIAIKAAKAGGWSLAGGVGFPVAQRFLLKWIRYFKKSAPWIEKGAQEGVSKRIDEGLEVLAPMEQKLGRTVRASSGQVADDPDVIGMEDYLRKNPRTYDVFYEQDRQLAKDFDDYFDAIQEDIDFTPTRASEFGNELQTQTQRRVGAIQREALAREETAQGALDEGLLDVTMARAKGPSIDTGTTIKNVLETEQAWSQRAMQDATEELNIYARDTIGSTTDPLFTVNKFKKAVKRLKGERLTNLVSRIDKNDVTESELGSILTNLEELTKTTGDRVSWENIQSTIHGLNRLIRKAKKGLLPGIDMRDAVMLRSAIGNDEVLAVRNSPKLAAKLGQYRDFVKTEHTRLDRSLVGKILGESNGIATVTEEAAFDQIIRPKNVKEAANIADIFKQSRGALDEATSDLYDAGWEKIRAGIVNKYAELVESKQTNRAKLLAHNKFFKDFGDTIKPFFSDKEFSNVQKVGGLIENAITATKRKDQVFRFLKTTLGHKIANKTNLTSIFNSVWNTGDRGELKRLISLTKKSPEMLLKLKGVVQRDLLKSLRKASPANPQVSIIDARGLGEYLAKHDEQLSLLFGQQYVDNLATLRAVADKVYNRPEGTKLATAADWLRHIVRAQVGLFTTPGRFMTAYLRIRGHYGDKILSDAMVDPRKLNELLKSRAKSMEVNLALPLISQAGAYTLAVSPDAAFGEP